MNIRFGEYMLRDWRRTDAGSLAGYADNRKIWKNLRDAFPHPFTRADATAFIERALAGQPPWLYAIATAGEVIGSIGLHPRGDVHRFSAELGYWLGEPYWNQGIMTAAVQRLVNFAFENFGLVRIQAEPYEYNHAFIRVLEKAGFACEGRLRSSVYKQGKFRDQLIYARLAREVNGHNRGKGSSKPRQNGK